MLMAAVERYVALRRATGFKCKQDAQLLSSFARFAQDHREQHIRSATAIAWAKRSTSEALRHRRLRVVRQLAEYLRLEDNIHELPPADVFFDTRQRPRPYIFSADERWRIVECAGQLARLGPLRPEIYATLFGLLAATGMRISEALHLQWQDVTADGLIIRESKFRKSRLLPLHETTRAALNIYLEQRRRRFGTNPYLFISRLGNRLSYTVVIKTFHAVLLAAGIKGHAEGRQPRLTDLRHSFAVNALLAMPDVRRDQIGPHIVALSTYLGHSKIDSTYWYLENTPELMTDIAQQSEAWLQGGAS